MGADHDNGRTRALERYGKNTLAREIAEHLRKVGKVFRDTGTLWENDVPDAETPGSPAKGDFVGWTGIVPILYLLEYGIGLKPDALHNRLTWELASDQRWCERFRFNGHVVSLVAQPSPVATTLSVTSDAGFSLRVVRTGKVREFAIQAGRNHLRLD